MSTSQDQPWDHADPAGRDVASPYADRYGNDAYGGTSGGTDGDAYGGTDGGTYRTATAEQPLPEVLRGPAVGTLVWGCVVLAVAALLGAWELAGLRLDLSLVVPVGMVVLGLLLVVGAVVTAVRSNRG